MLKLWQVRKRSRQPVNKKKELLWWLKWWDVDAVSSGFEKPLLTASTAKWVTPSDLFCVSRQSDKKKDTSPKRWEEIKLLWHCAGSKVFPDGNRGASVRRAAVPYQTICGVQEAVDRATQWAVGDNSYFAMACTRARTLEGGKAGGSKQRLACISACCFEGQRWNTLTICLRFFLNRKGNAGTTCHLSVETFSRVVTDAVAVAAFYMDDSCFSTI